MKSLTQPHFSFMELNVWRKAVAFATKVIQAVEDMETNRRHFRLAEQLEAASTSVAMNVAEGKGRQTTKEFIQYLYIARGSLFEVLTLLIILQNLKWITPEQQNDFQSDAEEITKMLNAMIKAMKSR
jgi:four helix bundle protein